MIVCCFAGYAAAWSALQKPDLKEIWFVDVFNRIDFLAKDGCYGADADRPSVKALDNGAQELAIDVVETVFVNIQHGQSVARNGAGDSSVGLDLCIVSNPLQ